MASRSSKKIIPPIKQSDLLLIIDDRERAVFPHLQTEAIDINFSIKRIEIGDYAIVDTLLNKIIAVFERKTLEDLASSLKDGRYENKTKMINLRTKTGCALFYILEGQVSPKPNSYFGGISYINLESAIYHMMVRDNIMLINTLNTLDTVNKLIRFYKSMVSLANKPVYIKDIESSVEQELNLEKKIAPLELKNQDQTQQNQSNAEETTLKTDSQKNINEIYNQKTEILKEENKFPVKTESLMSESIPTQISTNHLTIREPKSDKDILRELWSVFRGITVVSADMFLVKWTIADIIYHNIDFTRLPKGTKINKSIIRSLSSIDKRIEERLLSTIPMISESTSKQILTGRTLRQLLTYEVGAISIICIGKAQKKLGEVKANNIKKYMFMFYDTNVNKCVVKNSNLTLDSIKIAESHEEAIGKILALNI